MQTFYFLAALVTDVAQAVADLIYAPLSGLVSFVFFLAGVWLIYRGFRVVYGQGRWITIFKMAFVSFAYAVILIIGITVTGLAAALLVLGD
ncbi:MAG TPA: hypothetical protein VGG49_07750 [Steroidobacteraceae bacterium]